uniref:Monocarboxylate transporter 12-like n=1 Tax=Saccoglossus kowalevskii TaxID=10224 RepID=A0ABM0MF69_SACKO|nr:PREDICTED: monocarboxylate transporter 12-like [Saccoglossus kowalevskii]
MVSKPDKDPPDGGWGWLVVVGAFIVFFMSSGSYFAFGVLYVAFIDAFEESKAATAWVGSIYYLFLVMAGPFGICLSSHFGHRLVVVIGGLIATAGLILTSLATDLYQVCLTYSVMADFNIVTFASVGFGCGLCLIPGIEMVSVYFKKRLALALGLCMAGTGAGQICFAFLSQALLDIYGWRGMMLILSGAMLHLCVAGVLFKPLHDIRKSIPTTNYSAINDETEVINVILQNGKEMTIYSNEGLKNTSDVDNTCCVRKMRFSCVTSALSSLFACEMFKETVFYPILVAGLGQAFGQAIVTTHVVGVQ